MKFNSLAEVEATLARYIPAVQQITGKQINLERMLPLMKELGNPESKLRIIHLAGTSGKTSTAYYIASLLQTAGHTVGLTVSPHVDSITERVQVNLQPLTEAQFCESLGEFMELIKHVDPQPTYFELLIAFIYWHFAKIGVDYAVIETGLGGLLDGTNVATNADKICVITDIGHDHMNVLGNTLPEIALQKAGIIHPGNQAFMYRQPAEVTDVFVAYAHKQAAALTLYEQSALQEQFGLPELERLPLYQRRNWLLARAVTEFVAQRDGWQLPQDQIIKSLLIQVPGRMEEWHTHDKTIVMDGAHNEQKMQAFVSSFQQKYPGVKAAVLLSLKEGKEYQAVLPLLKPICSRLVLTTFNLVQELPARSIDLQVLEEAARGLDFPELQTIADPVEAYKALAAAPEEVLIVTGSFYLLSCIRPLIIQA